MKVAAPHYNYTNFLVLQARVDLLAGAIDSGDVLDICRRIRQVHDRLIEIADDVVEDAAKRTKLTQKSVAEALNVPVSTLRGWRA